MPDIIQTPGAPGQAPPQPPAGTPVQAPVPPPLAQAPNPSAQAPAQMPLPPVPPIRVVPMTQMYDYMVGSRQFDADCAAFQAHAGAKTGFLNLDIVQPFYPGFYCVGAISSLGKTSLVLQLCDQVAASGRYVFYFSLEQTAFELGAKSLSRGYFQTYLNILRTTPDPDKPKVDYPTPTSIDIRTLNLHGRVQERTWEINRYGSTVGNRMIVLNDLFALTVEDIANTTRDLARQLGVKPVVVVDYLQIIAPTLINGRVPDSKTSIDHIVQTLKSLQSELDIPLIAISSFNRQNYLTPVAFESFKESGGLEYTADILWGLELSILNAKEFYNSYDENGHMGRETTLKQKREAIRKAKASFPRKVDLVCLKNRYGRSSYRARFHYYPSHDYFEPFFGYTDQLATTDDLIMLPPGISIPMPAFNLLRSAAGTICKPLSAQASDDGPSASVSDDDAPDASDDDDAEDNGADS